MERKKVSRITYVKKNFIWSFIQNIFAVLFPLIIRTIFIYTLGDEYLGLNSLCNSIVTSLSVANLGIESVLIGNMYEPIAKGDKDEICRQLNLCRMIYRSIGLIILVGGLIILPFLDKFITGNVPNVNIYIVFIIYIFNSVAGYWLGYYRIVFFATQEVYLLNKLLIIGYICMYGLQIISLLKYNYYAYVLFMPIGTLLYTIGCLFKIRQCYPEYRCKGIIGLNDVKSLRKSVTTCAVYKLRNSSRDSLDGVIISANLGLVILSMYQNYTTILSMPILLRQIFVNAISPSLGNYNVEANKQEQFDVVKVLWLFELALSGVGATCYFQMIQGFVGIWLGDNHVLHLSVALMFGVYIYVLGICDFFQMIRQTNLLWEKGKSVACLEIIVNLILNIALVRVLGLIGIIMATVITILFICIPYELKLVFNDYFKQGLKSIVYILFKITVWLLISNIVIYFTLELIPYFKYYSIIIQGVVSVVICFALFLPIFGRDKEFKSLINMVIRMLKV